MTRPRRQNTDDEEMLLKFGRGVRRLREELGLSQEDFAELVDVHRTYVGMIERGEKSPTLGTVAAWARGFRMRSSQLLAKVGL
ncbi:transcriptional regulator [Opitutaceae bacterium TAV5]|nr:transcriptional regulator [Opitutaceae bacterium TAV5]